MYDNRIQTSQYMEMLILNMALQLCVYRSVEEIQTVFFFFFKYTTSSLSQSHIQIEMQYKKVNPASAKNTMQQPATTA